MANKKASILKICLELQAKYQYDFECWVRDFISFDGLDLKDLTDQQKEIGQGLALHKRIAVAAGTGIGKSAVAALLMQWFMVTHPHCKIPTTAPSGKQLRDILWSELDFWLNRNSLKKLYVRRKDLLHIHSFPEWYGVARTVPKDGKDLNDTLAGFHAPYMLIICDEASGIPDPVFTALDGAMTQENSYIFLISNPVSTGGYYYDTITEPDGRGKDYKVFFFSSKDSPLVDKNYELSIINRYGKDSPMYKSKVLGLPIAMHDTAIVAPETYDQVTKDNKLRFSGDICLGVDIGDKGEDPSVICHKQGKSIIKWDEEAINDTDYIVDKVDKVALGYARKGHKVTVVVDAIGVGAGAYSSLEKKKGYKTIGFMSSEKAFHKEMFKNKKSEGYYHLSNDFENLHFPVPPPERLKKELANLRFTFDDGPINMEPKKKFRSRTGISSDYADALMLADSIEIQSDIRARPNVSDGGGNVFKKLQWQSQGEKYGEYNKFIV